MLRFQDPSVLDAFTKGRFSNNNNPSFQSFDVDEYYCGGELGAQSTSLKTRAKNAENRTANREVYGVEGL